VTLSVFAIALIFAGLPLVALLAFAGLLARSGVWRVRLVDRTGRQIALLVLRGGG
jgi:hypothetical protein